MIVVFWLQREHADAPAQARHETFGPDRLGAALQFAEELRGRRRAGEAISHVAIQSELVESVGPAGVSDPSKDYAHYKRRLDPAQKLGRPSGNSDD